MVLIVALMVLALWPNPALADTPKFIRYHVRPPDAAGVPLTRAHQSVFAYFDEKAAGTSPRSEGVLGLPVMSLG